MGRRPRGVACTLAVALTAGCATNPAGNDAGPRLPAGISYQERTETYRITGADRDAIGQGIRAAPAIGGQGFAGYYAWQLGWHYQTQPQGPGCGIAQATVSIRSVVTLPEWTPPSGVDAVLVEEWQHYSSALAVHEAGHRDLVLAGAIRIQRALLRIPPQGCSVVQEAAQQIGQSLLAELKLENERYDVTTRHGATQGAVWAGTIQPWWQTR
jgi:predicted secreted Zn-dependent protease